MKPEVSNFDNQDFFLNIWFDISCTRIYLRLSTLQQTIYSIKLLFRIKSKTSRKVSATLSGFSFL